MNLKNRVELAAIDAHRATEAPADIERGFDDGVAGKARRDRIEIGDFPGRVAAGQFRSSSGQVRAQDAQANMVRNGSAGMCIRRRARVSPGFVQQFRPELTCTHGMVALRYH